MDRIEIRRESMECSTTMGARDDDDDARSTSTRGRRRRRAVVARIFTHRVVVSSPTPPRRTTSRASASHSPQPYRPYLIAHSSHRSIATHLREHGAGDAEGERALGHLFGEFVQAGASGDGLGGSAGVAYVAYRSSSVVGRARGANFIIFTHGDPCGCGCGRSLDRARRRGRARDDATPVSIEPMRWREILDRRSRCASSPSIGRARERVARSDRSRSNDRARGSRDRSIHLVRATPRRSETIEDEPRRSETNETRRRRTAWWPSPP